LAIGLAYVFVVPPWMHYDEPGHFEYAWLIANQEKWPEVGDYDQYMRREVAASMREHNFEDYTGVVMNVTNIDEPVSILIPQVGDSPLYYLLVSLPLRLVKYTEITFQLYIGRLVSLLLFLFTIWISSRLAIAIFGESHPIAWMLPCLLMAIPGFVELMTAINNDALAIAGFSAFFLVAAILLREGFTTLRAFLLFASAVVCYFAKSTAWLAIPLSALVITFSVIKGKRIKWAWIGLVISFITLIGLSLQPGTSYPAYFAVMGQNNRVDQQQSPQAVSGQFVLKHKGQQFSQMLTSKAQGQLQGKKVTLTAWIWADKPVEVSSPEFGYLDGSRLKLSEQKISLTTSPSFFSATVDLPTGNYVAWLCFFGSNATAIYWDDISLQPVTTGEIGGSGEALAQNVLRNGSIEVGWPMLSSKLDSLLEKCTLNFSFAQLYQLFDFRGISWYLSTTAHTIFRTFWGSFGWGAVPLMGAYSYTILLVVSSIVCLVGLIFMIDNGKSIGILVLLIFFFSVVAQTLLVITRGVGSWYSWRYYPGARYLFPVILPICLLLATGAYRLVNFKKAASMTGESEEVLIGSPSAVVYLLVLLLLAVWGLASNYIYYIN